VSAGLPDEISTWAKLLRFPPLEDIPEMVRGQSFAVIQTAYLGSEADGAELIRPLTDLGPSMNTFATVEPSALSYLAMDPEDPVPYTSRGRIVSDISAAGIDALVEATVESPELVMTELRALGGALGRRAPGAGVRATLDGDYLMFALGAVFEPEMYDRVHSQAERVEEAIAPWDAGIHYANFEEDKADARRFYDADSWRLLRALRTHWDPNGLFLANHEIKVS
jgi:hypothetical protein